MKIPHFYKNVLSIYSLKKNTKQTNPTPTRKNQHERTPGIPTYLFSKFSPTHKKILMKQVQDDWVMIISRQKGKRNVPEYELESDLSSSCGCESKTRSLQRCFYVSSNRSQTHSARAARRWAILQSVHRRGGAEGQRGHNVYKKHPLQYTCSESQREYAWLYHETSPLHAISWTSLCSAN